MDYEKLSIKFDELLKKVTKEDFEKWVLMDNLRSEKMLRPYLIQRAKFEKREGKGIDTLLAFDYMGSSEFECGALPKALKRTRENEKAYVQFEFTFENFEDKPIMILCKESDKEELPKILAQLADRELILKEYCDLDAYLNGNKDYRTSDFWWDIENDYFFWRSNEEFNNEFKKCLFENGK